MTYVAPAEGRREAITVGRSSGLFDADTATDAVDHVVSAVARVVARDVVAMVRQAMAAIEAHEPSCLSLYGDDACDCDWSRITGVLEQVRQKVDP